MEVVVGNPLLKTQIFPAIDVDGREHLVIVAKATWKLPAAGQRPQPVAAVPICAADEFYGEPGVSAVRRACDLVRFKPQCDIVFDAFAHVAQPQTTTEVHAQVGDWQKSIRAVGPRTWQLSVLGFEPSPPQTFVSMPLHSGLAFGGSPPYLQGRGKPMLREVYAPNPIGQGWSGSAIIGGIQGQPLPCLEYTGKRVRVPNGNYKPAGLNPIGASIPARQQYAGTYDEAWRRDVFPFLPEDFDERFFQCAPEDQRVPYLQGGEVVQLTNMLQGQPELSFRLPALNALQVRVLRRDYGIETPGVHADTLIFETEARRFSVVWRASVAIRRRIQEFNTVAVGPVDEQWWRARSLGLEKSGCFGCADGDDQ